jgi:hypothetical protein
MSKENLKNLAHVYNLRKLLNTNTTTESQSDIQTNDRDYYIPIAKQPYAPPNHELESVPHSRSSVWLESKSGNTPLSPQEENEILETEFSVK